MINTVSNTTRNDIGDKEYHSEAYCECDKCGEKVFLGEDLWSWEIEDAAEELRKTGWLIPVIGKCYCEKCKQQDMVSGKLNEWIHEHGRNCKEL